MLVSINEKFIYYHYPKTGGSTIQHTLKEFGHPSNGELQIPHSKNFWVGFGFKNGRLPKHYKVNSELDIRINKAYRDIDFIKLCSVRNPWDLVISTIKFRPDLYKGNLKNNIMNYNNSSIFKNYNTMSEFYNISDDIEDGVKIIKMENINNDLTKALPNLNLTLVNTNINRVDDDYRKYYDDESMEYIGELFKNDIINFKYKF